MPIRKIPQLQSLILQLSRLTPTFLRQDSTKEDLSNLWKLSAEIAFLLNVSTEEGEALNCSDKHLDFGSVVAALTGDLSDAAEKADHLEEFSPIAKKAIRQLLAAIKQQINNSEFTQANPTPHASPHIRTERTDAQ